MDFDFEIKKENNSSVLCVTVNAPEYKGLEYRFTLEAGTLTLNYLRPLAVFRGIVGDCERIKYIMTLNSCYLMMSKEDDFYDMCLSVSGEEKTKRMYLR